MNTARHCVLFLLATLPLHAQQPGADSLPRPTVSSDRITVTYLDGRATTVEVLELRGSSVRVRSQIYGGSVVHLARLDQFEPMSRYRLTLAAGQPTSFEQHFAIAKAAGGWRLLPQTAMHLRSALVAAQEAENAAELQEQVRDWAATWLETIVQESIAAGDLREAERRLEILCSRLADKCSEERVEQLAVEIDALRAKQEAARSQQRQQRLQERERNEIEGRMQPIMAQVEAGDRSMREAMRHARRTVQTTRLAGAAMDAYRAAWVEAQVLLKRYPDHEALAAELAALAISLQERSVKAALHAATAQTMQSNFRSALNWVDRALEIDPENAESKELQRTILVASAAAGGWGWGWGWGGMPFQDPARLR